MPRMRLPRAIAADKQAYECFLQRSARRCLADLYRLCVLMRTLWASMTVLHCYAVNVIDSYGLVLLLTLFAPQPTACTFSSSMIYSKCSLSSLASTDCDCD